MASWTAISKFRVLGVGFLEGSGSSWLEVFDEGRRDGTEHGRERSLILSAPELPYQTLGLQQ